MWSVPWQRLLPVAILWLSLVWPWFGFTPGLCFRFCHFHKSNSVEFFDIKKRCFFWWPKMCVNGSSHIEDIRNQMGVYIFLISLSLAILCSARRRTIIFTILPNSKPTLHTQAGLNLYIKIHRIMTDKSRYSRELVLVVCSSEPLSFHFNLPETGFATHAVVSQSV